MNDNNIKKVMSKALEFSLKKHIFTVKIFRPNEPMYERKRMTYLELGLYLTQNVDIIDNVYIYMSE